MLEDILRVMYAIPMIILNIVFWGGLLFLVVDEAAGLIIHYVSRRRETSENYDSEGPIA